MCRQQPCVPHDGSAQSSSSTASTLRNLAATKVDQLTNNVLSRATSKSLHLLLLRFRERLCLIERKVPGWFKMALIHLASRVLCYWLPNLLLFAMQRSGVGRRWRIQGDKMPSAKLFSHTLRHNIFGDAIAYWGISFVFHKLLTLGGRRENGQLEEEAKLEEATAPNELSEEASAKGWSGLRFGGAFPCWTTQLWQVAVGYVGYDMLFYWSHRLLHQKSIYKYVHKHHHKFHTPVGLACSHEHPVESAIQLVNWYAPIGAAGWLNGELHWSTLFLYNCMRWLETVDAHSGYELPFSPFHRLPLFGGARMHDYHHRAFWGNYGASFFWDWLCGTDKAYWQEVIEDGVLMGGKYCLSP